MNPIKEWLLKKLNMICPKCGSRLLFFAGCSRVPMTEFCENKNCDYKKVYPGIGASGISRHRPAMLCPECGGKNLVETLHAGITEIRCGDCGATYSGIITEGC